MVEVKESTDNAQDQLKQNLDHIQNEINQLSNDDSSDDKVENMDGILTTAFADYLKKQDIKLVDALYRNVSNIIEKSSGNVDPNLQKIKDFLAPLIDSAKLEGSMEDNFSDEEAKEYKGKIGRIENLKETKDNLIGSLDEKINKLNGENDDLVKALSNIKIVVERPNTANVKSLQKFILKNLSGEAKQKFLNYNFKVGSDGKRNPDNPDGMFGQNLVDGINVFLQSLDGYITQVETSRNIQSENDDIAKKQAEQRVQEEAKKLAEQKEQERVNNLNMGEIVNNEDGEVIRSLSSGIARQIDDIIEIENSDVADKNEKLLRKFAKFESKLKKNYMDLFVEKEKARQKNKPMDEYEKKLNTILKFGSWKINRENGDIIDDTDNKSDYRKYADKIGKSVGNGNDLGEEGPFQIGNVGDSKLEKTDVANDVVEVKSYGSIGETVENGKVKDDAIKEENGNKYVMIGNEKYFYYNGDPDALALNMNYCIQYEDKVYFGKLDPNKGTKLEGGQFVDKDGKITAVEANLTAADEETGTHETPVVELDLSQYRNSDSKIDLSSLTTLTKAQAEILATTSGTLILDGLKTIDADIAEKLNKHEGFLSLNGIENLSKDVADKFKNRKSTMSFNSIKKFEQGVSEFIGTSEGGLSLAGLEEISNDDAKNIGNHKGIMIHENDSFNNTITLSSLKHITVEQAKLLGKFEGEIQLNGLESLDEQTAKEFANSQLSQIYFDNPEFDKLVREINPDKIPQYVDMGR